MIYTVDFLVHCTVSVRELVVPNWLLFAFEFLLAITATAVATSWCQSRFSLGLLFSKHGYKQSIFSLRVGGEGVEGWGKGSPFKSKAPCEGRGSKR